MAASPSRQKPLSAGLLMLQQAPDGALQVFLAHPGGPFFARKDKGAWSIPKGLVEEGESPLQAALREFEEETGLIPTPPFHPLGEVRQKGGKQVHAWAFEGSLPEGWRLASDTFEMEWPPRSGLTQSFPEIDRARFFDLDTAREKINAAQAAFIDRMVEIVGKK